MEGFCTLCNFQVESFEGLKCCPNCGSKGVPCDYKNQINISINIHELKILALWAENYASCDKKGSSDGTMKDTVYAITNRIRKQVPNQDLCLTWADELRGLEKAFPGVKTNLPAADDPEFPPDMYQPDK
jgi:hypothetical protein